LQQKRDKPLLLLDIDGVISLFGFDPDVRPSGSWHLIEGIGHFLSSTASAHLQRLSGYFDPVWCSGWEERADEHLPTLLGVPSFPHLSFDRNPGRANAHWKLAAIDDVGLLDSDEIAAELGLGDSGLGGFGLDQDIASLEEIGTGDTGFAEELADLDVPKDE
jgi:hypothetical protein